MSSGEGGRLAQDNVKSGSCYSRLGGELWSLGLDLADEYTRVCNWDEGGDCDVRASLILACFNCNV